MASYLQTGAAMGSHCAGMAKRLRQESFPVGSLVLFALPRLTEYHWGFIRSLLMQSKRKEGSPCRKASHYKITGCRQSKAGREMQCSGRSLFPAVGLSNRISRFRRRCTHSNSSHTPCFFAKHRLGYWAQTFFGLSVCFLFFCFFLPQELAKRVAEKQAELWG